MSDADTTRDRILANALGVFGRYGYRRTSMDLIAQAAEVSRPAVYQYFTGKVEVLRAAASRMQDDFIRRVETAAATEAAPADRLYLALVVKLDFVAGTVEAKHRSELLTEAAQHIPDVVAAFEHRYLDAVTALLDSVTGELDLLDEALPTRDAARLLLAALTGIVAEAAPQSVLRARLRQLVDLTVRGLSTTRDNS